MMLTEQLASAVWRVEGGLKWGLLGGIMPFPSVSLTLSPISSPF